MISKKAKKKDLLGKKAIVTGDLMNAAREGVRKGTIVTIIDVHTNEFDNTLVIERTRCPDCGQYFKMWDVRRSELTLLEGQEETKE